MSPRKPPQLIPHEPTLDNYIRVWNFLPVNRFFINSIVVTLSIVVLNTLFTSMAAYPLAKMKFKGSNIIFYLLQCRPPIQVQSNDIHTISRQFLCRRQTEAAGST